MRLVSGFISTLKVATALDIGEILHARKAYTSIQSARVNAQKKLNVKADLGEIEKCNGFYRTLDCKSDYKDHAKLLTKATVEILKRYDAIIYREHTITSIGLRPDALVLLKRENIGRCFILEVVNNEPEQYLKQKIDVWRSWPDALDYLSSLFKYRIPHFDIVVSGDLVIDGTIPLKEAL
jgi:hypothetical protein